MTEMTFRPLVAWPQEDTEYRTSRNVFSASWSATVELLYRELDHLDARNIVCQADFRDADIRLDGMPRANARVPEHPGVIISFDSKHGPLQYKTDAFEYWKHNVRAIALGLEALRKVDRYRISKSGEQYKGYRQLTAGSGITSREAAISLLEGLSGIDLVDEHGEEEGGVAFREAYRVALIQSHPDHGGDGDTFQKVRDAGKLLDL